MTDAGRQQAWEERYDTAAVWTGKVNAHLTEWVEANPRVAPATAIDLACGEGGDAI